MLSFKSIYTHLNNLYRKSRILMTLISQWLNFKMINIQSSKPPNFFNPQSSH